MEALSPKGTEPEPCWGDVSDDAGRELVLLDYSEFVLRRDTGLSGKFPSYPVIPNYTRESQLKQDICRAKKKEGNPVHRIGKAE